MAKQVRFAGAIVILWVLAVIATLPGCGTSAAHDPVAASGAITADEMNRHEIAIASDAMQGRNTPSPGLDSAAEYIARVFAQNGFQPVRGSYFQPVPLAITALGEPNGLRVRKGGREQSYEIKTDFVPFEMTATGEVRAPLVFAGYGITAPEYKYDDYASVDVKGKVVLVLRHEPGEDDSNSVFEGKMFTKYASVGTKVRIAKEHGAVGLLLVTDPLNHSSLTPRGFPWPSLSRTIPRDALPMTLGGEEGEKIPAVQVGPSVIEQVLGDLEGLKSVQARIDSTLVPHSFPLVDTEVWVQTSTKVTEIQARNVVGVIEGSDPLLRDQVVIVGAHYDHVGVKRQNGSEQDTIYNGADDNASGTCAVLGVAAGFGSLSTRPRRTVLLMTFAGEEKGLLGSEYYARQPLFPLDQTVAMINIDMVGRNSIDSLWLIGGERSPDLAQIAEEENKLVGFTLLPLILDYGGSDHQSFQKRGVPSIMLHSGVHPDLHKVSDNPELIDPAKIARAAKLAFLTAWRLANETGRYHYNAPLAQSPEP